MSSADSLIALCPVADVREGEALKVETGDHVLAVFNLGGRYFVIDDACTHGPGSLSEGCIEDDIVECNFHNGAFNIVTGEVAAPPCMFPVRTYRVEIVDGQVCIDPSQRAA